MKFFTSVVAATGLFSTAFAGPIQAERVAVVPRTGYSPHVPDVYAAAKAHVEAALAICLSANIDINAALSVREAVALQLKADLDAAIAIVVEATAQIKAAADVDIELGNGDCDKSCVEKTAVDVTADICADIDIIVDILGEDCAKPHVKGLLTALADIALCLDKVYVGIKAKVGACIKAVLGLVLCLRLGLDLTVLLGIILG